MEKKLVINHFTDPLCFWCYAMEPEMRKIRVLLDGQAEYRIVMGVLSTDVHEIIGYDDESRAQYEAYRRHMAYRLLKAAETIGMPIAIDHLLERKPEDSVSLNLCLAYCSMRIIDEGMAEAYLRRMRECVYAEGRSISSVDKLVELAREFPVDIERFRGSIEDGAALALLQESVEECRANDATVFPTLLMEYDGRRALLNGYFDYDAIKRTIAKFTDGEICLSDAEFSIHALESYVKRFGKVAAREIQTMFSLNDVQLANVMMDLADTGRYTTQRCGTSYFVIPK